MSELSRFFGIVIAIFFEDHGPPHIHIMAAEFQASLAIADGRLLAGKAPGPLLKLVRQWMEMHRDELFEAWKLTQSGKNPYKIAPLRTRR